MSKEDAIMKATEIAASGHCCRHLTTCLKTDICYFSSSEKIEEQCKCEDFRVFSALKTMLAN